GSARYRVSLPSGDWYDTETLAKLPGGTQELASPAGDSVRLFARAGAIIPEGPLAQNTAEAAQGALTLTVWPGPECTGSLYIGDGASFAYQQGKLRRLQLSCEVADTSLSVQATSTGDYPPWWQELRLVLHEVPRAPAAVVDAKGAALTQRF